MVENENDTLHITTDDEAAQEPERAPRRRRSTWAPTVDEPTAEVSLPRMPYLIDAADDQAEEHAAEPDAPIADAPSESPTQSPAAPARPGLQVLFQAPPVLAPAIPNATPIIPTDDDDEDDDEDPEEESGVSRRSRRRSRRRSGAPADQQGSDGSVTEVVPKTRPVRAPITEPQRVKGSTRLEAKRQRRRDGRDAGRRRTVVTEAEFLARREAVDRVMVVRSIADRVEIGVLEDGVLAEHYVAKSQQVSLIGNVYLGRVQNVLPSMEAAFVDIGRGRNAVLYSGEVDWDAASDRIGDKGSQGRRIELALKSGDRVLVQVTKDAIGHKGARLTSAVSLPGRYLVYVPNGSMSGISRKLPDTERTRLKRILKDALPDSAGVIVRTAAEGATEEQLVVDVQRLANQWAEISRLTDSAAAPSLLHAEPDLVVKIIRDVFNEDFTKLVIAGSDARETIERYVSQVAPDLLDRIEAWEGDGDVFAHYRLSEQIDKALDRKVWLPSGGSLVIDRTEAMTVIDVNTGKFVGSGGNLEETVTKNNLEAAEEIVRQLRLRDIGGIIVIDFIDMVLESNRDLVLRRLVECLSRDRTKHQVAEVTSLGLVQMTRKRLGVGLAESVVDAAPGTSDPRPEPQQSGRRRRGGGSAPAAPARPVAHAITESARGALAQIAGATLVHKHDELDGHEHEHEHEHEREREHEHDLAHEHVHEHEHETAPAPAAEAPVATDEPVTLLDLPIAPHATRDRAPETEAAGLLDAVLGALPEPKRAGEGRRSRRVSTPALTPPSAE